jgi:Xaa-Pro aminopeptidase
MISRARAEASRSNGRKSRGPRTAAGRSCASHNALRHGLAALTYKPAAFAEVERIAKAICNGDTNPLLFEQALVIAENEMVLRCVRVEAIALIERLRDITAKPLSKRDNSLTRAKARLGQAKLRYRQLVQAKAKKIATTTGNEKNSLQEQESEAAQSQPIRMQRPIKSRDEFDALRLAMPDLDRLGRYERRAWSRQKRAFREFIEIKSRRES